MKKIVLLFSLFFTTASFAQNVKLVVPDGHAKHVEQCYVSADGKYLATVAYSTVIVWDIQSEKKLYELNVPISSVQLKDYNIQLSKDLKNVLLTCDNGVYYYSLQDGQKIFEEGGGSNGAMLSADEQYVYNMDYNSIELLDAQSGSSVRRFEKIMDGLEYGHGSKFFENTEKNELVVITELGWAVIDLTTGNTKIKKKVSENGNFSGYTYDQKSGTIIGAGDDGLRIYNAYTGVLLKSKKFTNSIFNICLTNDRQLAVIGLNYKAQLYTTELYAFPDLTIAKSTSQKGTEVPESIFYGNVCSTIPGTDKIVFNNNTDLQFYNTKDAAITKAFNNKVTDFKKFYYFSGINQHPLPDSVFALSTEDLGTRVFNTETFRPESFSPGVEWPIWSPNGKLIAGINQKITVADRATGKTIKTFALPAGLEYNVDYFFFSSDNSKIIYTSRSTGAVGAIDINTGLATKYFTIAGGFFYCTASLDGKYFVCVAHGSKNDLRNVYSLQTKALVSSKPITSIPGVESIQFLNGSYNYAILGQKGEASICSVELPDKEVNFTVPNYNIVRVVGSDVSSDLIAFGETAIYQEATHNIKLYHLDGSFVKEITSKDNAFFMKASFTSAGKIMYTPTTKKGVQVWNTETGELLGTYYFIEKTNEYIFVSPEGLFDGSVEGMKELYFVKNNMPIPLEKLYEQFYTPDLLRRKINGEKFLPPDVASLHNAPKVKISYAAAQRNLEVSDDMPTYQNTTGAAEITVTANADDDAIDEIRLFQNGKILNLVTRNLIVEDDKSKTAVKKYTISLLPGVNNIRAVALNTQRTESDPDEIAVIYKAANTQNNTQPVVNYNNNAVISPVDKNATLHLVVVGINAYKNPALSLNYALADATSFKDEVEKDAKSVISNIKTYFVADNDADKTGITNALKQVQQNAKPQDVFMFYYAGHGVINNSNKEFYLVPNDVTDLKNVDAALEANGISAKLLQEYAINIQAQKQLFILDACQSAGAFTTLMTNNANQQKTIAVVARSTGTHWMAASGSQQFANEFAALGHGAFTYVLLQALKGEAANNKMITVNGLKNFLEMQVPALMKKYNGTQQVPASYGFGNDFPVELLQ